MRVILNRKKKLKQRRQNWKELRTWKRAWKLRWEVEGGGKDKRKRKGKWWAIFYL